MDHEEILKLAFSDPKCTAIELPPDDVNATIREHYKVDKPFTYTRTQLWDMEVRKASRPDKYLSHIVRPGSLERFPSTWHGQVEDFVRVTDQKLWKDLSQYTRVIEHVRLDHNARRAFFVGADEFITPDGRKIVKGGEQLKFHVEHSVLGTEEQPLNAWRIVHLTDGKDQAILDVFDKFAKNPYLREFNEVYIRDDLKLRLDRK